MNELPSMNELFELIEDNHIWKKIKNSYFIITSIIADCIRELIRKADNQQEQIKKDIDDYKYYARRYLIRSARIYRSMVLLFLYNYHYEAAMIKRPFLENIAETKYFLKNRHRAKAIGKIKLYELINEMKRFDSTYLKDLFKTDKNGYVITSKYFYNSGKELLNKINEELLNYKCEEVDAMLNKINKNYSWHGLHRKSLFTDKNVEMGEYIGDYDVASQVLHVRENNPCAIIKDEGSYINLIQISLLLLEHLKDYKNICNETLGSEEKISKLDKLYEELDGLFSEVIKKYIPNSIELLKFKITQDE
jgi:hypothetical protein